LYTENIVKIKRKEVSFNKMKTVRLIECINWTWFGENQFKGKKCILLRFKRCERNCIFCDTKIKMKVMEEAEYS